MMSFRSGVPVAAAMAIALTLPVAAAPADFELELVGKPAKTGDLVEFAVQLVRKQDGTPVSNAQLTVEDFNMEPEGMLGSAAVEVLPAEQGGPIHLKVHPEMGGKWSLVYSAEVAGEPALIEGRLVVELPH